MFEYLDLCLPEIGRVKIGQKGEKITSKYGNEFQKPEKLDYFKIVTLNRGEDGNFETDKKAHEIYGEKPRTLKIKPLSDKMQDTIQGGYALYSNKGERICFGDGRTGNYLLNKSTGEVEQIQCPCKQYVDGYCKKWAKASFVLKGVGGLGGIHTMKIQGKITVPAFIGSFKAIYDICQSAGVSIANTELELKLREVQTKNGKVYSPYFFFPGTAEELIATAKKLPSVPSTNFGVLTEETDEAEETEETTNDSSEKTETDVSENQKEETAENAKKNEAEAENKTETENEKTSETKEETETTAEPENTKQEAKPSPTDTPRQPKEGENVVGEIPTKKWETKETKENKESKKTEGHILDDAEKERRSRLNRIIGACKKHYGLNNADACREIFSRLLEKKIETSADLTNLDIDDLKSMFVSLDARPNSEENPNRIAECEAWILKTRAERRERWKEEAAREEAENEYGEDEADETEYGAE